MQDNGTEIHRPDRHIQIARTVASVGIACITLWANYEAFRAANFIETAGVVGLDAFGVVGMGLIHRHRHPNSKS